MQKYTYEHKHAETHTHIITHRDTHIRTSTHKSTHNDTHINTHTYTHPKTHKNTYKHVGTHKYAHKHTNTHKISFTHIQPNTYIHTSTQISVHENTNTSVRIECLDTLNAINECCWGIHFRIFVVVVIPSANRFIVHCDSCVLIICLNCCVIFRLRIHPFSRSRIRLPIKSANRSIEHMVVRITNRPFDRMGDRWSVQSAFNLYVWLPPQNIVRCIVRSPDDAIVLRVVQNKETNTDENKPTYIYIYM